MPQTVNFFKELITVTGRRLDSNCMHNISFIKYVGHVVCDMRIVLSKIILIVHL